MFDRYWLVLVVAYYQWVEVSDAPTQDATALIASCSNWFSHLMLADECVSDNSPAFRSEQFSQFLQELGVKQTFTPLTTQRTMAWRSVPFAH